MSRQDPDKKSKNARRKGGGRGFRIRGRTILAAVLAAIIGLGVYQWLSPGVADGEGRSWHVMGGERRPVLDPWQFGSPFVRAQYTAAQQHGDTMDQVYCYCHCDQPPFLHKSLLSCFTDKHAAG